MTLRNAFEGLAVESKQGDLDIFGQALTGERNNQIEVHLDDSNWATYVNQTNSGGGGPTQTAGAVSFATGTGTNGRSSALSLDTIKYRPGFEIYGGWTAAFPTAGVASSYQRVGLMDDGMSNGVVVGYEGTSFGISWFKNGALVSSTPQASWNQDKCDGSVGSKFTRNGVPEALNPAAGNLYRVSAGLFGYAGFVVSVLSPDMDWVAVHVVKHVNASIDPVFSNYDLKMGVDVRKTGAGASDLSVRSGCWCGGTTIDKDRLSDPITDRSLAQTVRAVIEGKAPNGTYVKFSVNSQGRLQVTNDSVGVDGATAPASSTAVGGVDTGGNLQSLAVDTTGNLRALPLPAGASSEATQAKRFGGGKLPKTATVTAIGDTTIHTPAAGKRIVAYWVTAISDPNAPTKPLITVKFGGASPVELYRGYAISHWEEYVGAVDAPLVVNLDIAGTVPVSLTYVEL